ncbi:MAG: hypothetical protein GY940_26165 [bacterium]|nr:hypothetical protein [bacterium]
MAKPINAIATYGPKIKQQATIQMNDLVTHIAGRTSINEGAIMNLLIELRDALLYFNRMGQPVKLEGLGTFTPKIALDGEIRVAHRTDSWLKSKINEKRKFHAKILNRNMIGKTFADLIARWNEEHPDDPVE